MNYYLEKISKTQQQLDIAKVGFTQVTRDIIAKTDDKGEQKLWQR